MFVEFCNSSITKTTNPNAEARAMLRHVGSVGVGSVMLPTFGVRQPICVVL
jgi:hypothetical protein